MSPNINKKEPSPNIIIEGPAGSGKTTLLQKRYSYLTGEAEISPENILVIVQSRLQITRWRQFPGIKTFSGFMKEELSLYYPMVLEACSEIKTKNIQPKLLDFQAALYLMSLVVESRRQKNGFFSSVASTVESLSAQLLNNLQHAVSSGIPVMQIGERLYNAAQEKDKSRALIFSQGDEIISAYYAKCLEMGIFDQSLVTYLYVQYLMNNQEYQKSLQRRITHLIADDIQEAVPVFSGFVGIAARLLKSCTVAFNNEGGIKNHEIFEDNIKRIYEAIPRTMSLQSSYTCSYGMMELADKLYGSIVYNKKEKYKGLDIEIIPQVEMRSEMLEKAGQRITALIKEDGISPSDIVVISTYGDPVTGMVLERILNKQKITLYGPSRDKYLADNPLCGSLLTFACLCHPRYGIGLTKVSKRTFIQLLFGMDAVRSSILSDAIPVMPGPDGLPDIEKPELLERIGFRFFKKYNILKSWVEHYLQREEPLSLEHFFNAALQEIFLPMAPSLTAEDLKGAIRLMDNAKSFVEAVNCFGRDGERNFIETARRAFKMPEDLHDIEKALTMQAVRYLSPDAFVSEGFTAHVVVLLGTGSINWTPRSIRELSNPYVFSPGRKADEIYTEDTEESNRRRRLGTILRLILKHCSGKLITFESLFSSAGFENNGILSAFICDITEED